MTGVRNSRIDWFLFSFCAHDADMTCPLGMPSALDSKKQPKLFLSTLSDTSHKSVYQKDPLTCQYCASFGMSVLWTGTWDDSSTTIHKHYHTQKSKVRCLRTNARVQLSSWTTCAAHCWGNQLYLKHCNKKGACKHEQPIHSIMESSDEVSRLSMILQFVHWCIFAAVWSTIVICHVMSCYVMWDLKFNAAL